MGGGCRPCRNCAASRSPNDHFDLLFNAVTDAALALATGVAAAEALGLGTCPISVIRDHAAQIGELLGLPGTGDPACRALHRLAVRPGPDVAAAAARHDPAPRPL